MRTIVDFPRRQFLKRSGVAVAAALAAPQAAWTRDYDAHPPSGPAVFSYLGVAASLDDAPATKGVH